MENTNVLNSNLVRWMETGPESDIAISSRVRLARNISAIPFPHLLRPETGDQCIKKIGEAWYKTDYSEENPSELMTFDQLSALDKNILMEKHLISPAHAEAKESYRGILVNKEGSFVIMINEEDHMRIQSFLPGLQVEQCYRFTQAIDDALEQYLDIAFDEKRGYLTSCPTNVGSGMRASVMLHLPAMVISGQIKPIIKNVTQLGMVVRGIYGEGSEAIGNLFQVSNQITLGQTEEDINESLTAVSKQVIEQERLVRQNMMTHMKLQLEDRICRAYGILTNARMITSNEALAHLSDVRLGADLGILPDVAIDTLNELIVAIRPAHLQRNAGREMSAVYRDESRAEIIKRKLKQ